MAKLAEIVRLGFERLNSDDLEGLLDRDQPMDGYSDHADARPSRKPQTVVNVQSTSAPEPRPRPTARVTTPPKRSRTSRNVGYGG